MKQKLMKLILPALYALTILPVVIAPLTIYGSPYPSWGVFLYFLAFCLYGWALAVFLPEGVKGIWHLLATLIVPAVLPFVFWPWGADPWWMKAIAAVVAVFGAVSSDRRSVEDLENGLTAGLVVTCVSMYAVSYTVIAVVRFVLEEKMVYLPDTLLGYGLVSFFGGMYLLNWIFTMRMANVRGGTRVPATLRTSNIVMITILTVIALLAANFGTIRDAISRFVRNTLAAIIDFIMNFKWGDSSASQDTAEVENEISGILPAVPGKETPDWLLTAIKFGAILLALAIAGVVLFFLGRAFFRLLRRIFAWLRNWLNTWQSSQKTEYVDEQEDNFSWDRVRQEAGKTLRKITKPFRRVRLEQLPDDRARVRQLYAWTLERLQKKDAYVASETPLETGSRHLKASENGERFIDAYNRARYSEHPVDAADVAAGREVMKKL